MILSYILTFVLMMIAGHFKGCLDAIADDDIKGAEWFKKYDFTKPSETKHWWYLGLYKPRFPEKFPFSTTILVCLTDRWHLAQFVMLRAFYLAIALHMWPTVYGLILLPFVIFPIIVGVFFEASYHDSRKRHIRKTEQLADQLFNDDNN
jgi:hypothetical protein